MKPVLVWIRHPPHTTNHLSEAIRILAMTSALDIPIQCLFMGEGVRALVRDQVSHLLGPPLDRSLQGIVTPSNPALVHLGSLEARGIGPERISPGIPIRGVHDREVAEALAGALRVVPL